jgi:hypothetical protein
LNNNEIIPDDVIEKYFKKENKPEILPIQEPEPISEIEILSGKDVMEIDETKLQDRKITLDDLPERNNRGFSVDIPERKSNNMVERIGSNKEVRDGDSSKVYFKKR